jgi:AAA family ATP:ADP antiporter
MSETTTALAAPPSALAGVLARAVHAEPHELKGVLLAFAYFFCLMAGYYILRPLRDAMALTGGVDKLPWLFSGTFAAMLVAVPTFSALAARMPRHRLIPLCYRFFIVAILGFWLLFELGAPRVGAARAFFIGTSVYNLFVVSVFWSFMADIFRHGQGARLFGFIAAGGSAGALVGPLLTTLLVNWLGTTHLLLVSAVFLELAVQCVRALHLWSLKVHGAQTARVEQQPVGGDLWSGLRGITGSPFLLAIGAYVLLLTATATFLYLEQAQLISRASGDPRVRTAIFARIDLFVNVATLVLQGFVTGRLLRRAGIRVGLALLPVVTALGFVALAIAPTLAVLMVAQAIRRAAHHGIERPSREVLFTVVEREQKYKAKNFIDTIVYRGGDALSAWVGSGLQALGLGAVPVAVAAVGLSGIWLWNSLFLARRDRVLEAEGPHAVGVSQ